MDTLSREELKDLVAVRSRACVSLYMPTHRVTQEAEQDPVRFRNLVRTAEDALVQSGWTQDRARAYLAPLHDIAQDHGFWRGQADGLAVLRWPDGLRTYREPVRFPEQVSVGARFRVKPLLAALTADGTYWVLAFSQQDTRLFRGSREGLAAVEVRGLPRSLEESQRGRGHVPPQPTQLTATQRGSGGIHGHGGGWENSEKRYLLDYARAVDKALHEVLRNDTAPLVLYAAEWMAPLYREGNTYPHLVDAWVNGNADRLNSVEVHRKAWPLVEPWFRARRDRAARLFVDHAGTPRASDLLETVITAAHQGRVLHLFVPLDAQVWGTFDPATGRVRTDEHATPDNEDLLDLAGATALATGAEVYAVAPGDMPGHGEIAAVFRY